MARIPPQGVALVAEEPRGLTAASRHDQYGNAAASVGAAPRKFSTCQNWATAQVVGQDCQRFRSTRAFTSQPAEGASTTMPLPPQEPSPETFPTFHYWETGQAAPWAKI